MRNQEALNERSFRTDGRVDGALVMVRSVVGVRQRLDSVLEELLVRAIFFVIAVVRGGDEQTGRRHAGRGGRVWKRERTVR